MIILMAHQSSRWAWVLLLASVAAPTALAARCDGKLAAHVNSEWNNGVMITFKVLDTIRGLRPGTPMEMRFRRTCKCWTAFNVDTNFTNSGSRVSIATKFLDYDFSLICEKPENSNAQEHCIPLAYSIKGVKCSAKRVSQRSCKELGWEQTLGGFGQYEVCASSVTVGPNPVCLPEAATFGQAELACTQMGARLCTQTELRSDEARNTGCDYNSHRVWSRTPCQGSGHRSLSGASFSFGTYPTICSFPRETIAVRCCADREEIVRTKSLTIEIPEDDTEEAVKPKFRDFDQKINCGGVPFDGYVADSVNFFDKATFSHAIPVGTHSLDNVFSSARYQRREPLVYRIPLVEGTYNVTLGFAELFVNEQKVGARVIDIEVGSVGDNETFQSVNFVDVFRRVGTGILLKTFRDVSVKSHLSVKISSRVGNPFINAIQISSKIEDFSVSSTDDHEEIEEWVTIDPNITHQEIDGIGGSFGWYHDWLQAHQQREEILDLIFRELRISVLRLRNAFGRAASKPFAIEEAAPWLVQEGKKRGVYPRVLLSSWSPPSSLKANNDLRGNGQGATLRKDRDGKFVYGAFADYWVASLKEYAKRGVYPTWISIQNEPNFDPAWEGCAFDSKESEHLPSYNSAWVAVRDKVAKLPRAPELIGPEVTGIGNGILQDYVDGMSGPVTAIGHHLYGEPLAGGDGGYWLDPPSYLQQMKEVREYAERRNLKVFQTEMARLKDQDESDPIRLAWMIHNSFVVEGVAMYLHWDLAWGSDEATLIRMESPFANESPGYTVHQSFYAFKQFSGFVRQGWLRIDATTSTDRIKVSAYTSPDRTQVSVIIINVDLEDAELRISGAPNRSAKMYVTDRDTLKCVMHRQIVPGEKVLVRGQSIATLAYR